MELMELMELMEVMEAVTVVTSRRRVTMGVVEVMEKREMVMKIQKWSQTASYF